MSLFSKSRGVELPGTVASGGTQRVVCVWVTLSLLGLSTLAAGCSEEKKAVAHAAPARIPTGRHKVIATPVPVGGTAGPAAAGQRTAGVELLELDWDPKVQTLAETGYRQLSLRVRVTGKSERVRLHVRPDRFAVRTADGILFPALQSQRREPSLPTEFLSHGEKVEGWLTFQYTANATPLQLVCDVSIPPFVLPLVEAGS